MQVNDSSRPKVDWIEDKRFEKDGIVVLVNKLPLRHPKFSLSVGRSFGDGERMSRFFPIQSAGQGKITVERVSSIITSLMSDAEDYVQSEFQYAEDSKIDQNQHYENKDMNRGKKRAPVGLSGGPNSGKTARKKANRAKRLAEG